jgi:hypothetical protein
LFNFESFEEPKLKRSKRNDEKKGDAEAPQPEIAAIDTTVPVFSHQPKKQGICSFESCNVRTIQKKGFCGPHWNAVVRQRTVLANELAVKCPETRENCHRTLGYAQQKCKHHENARIHEDDVDDEAEDFDSEMKKVDEAIEKFVKPIAGKGIDYYFGMTYSDKLRINKHLSEYRELIKAKSNENNILSIPLIKCVGVKKAARLEQMAISRCVLNDDKSVRSKLLNACEYIKINIKFHFFIIFCIF